jgi:UDP-N-acetylglucosamine--N-acetylmuramyl-(pentapeptide) pyrophosphoryl-undecaprenol N-acetylglucosamine transferase
VKVIICSGGTGGHMFPACALFKSMRRKGFDVSMITDGRGNAFCGDISEKTVLNTVRFSYKKLFSVVFHFISIFLKFFGMWVANCPDVIIGFGGILTFVPIIVAKLFGAKVVIYEQNAIIGKANKLLQKVADLKLSTFKLNENWLEIAAPVREEFLKSHPYKCDKNIKILVMGGSQGALSFAKIIPEAMALMSPKERNKIEIIQQVDRKNIQKLSEYYRSLEIKAILKIFIDNMAEIMNEAQLVICRSGASTLSELAAIGRPAVLIPYPESSGNHQLYNAMYYQNKKAAWVLEEKQNIADELTCLIRQILQNRELLKVAASNMINDSVKGATDNFIKLIGGIMSSKRGENIK